MLVGIEQYEEQLVFPRCRGAANDAAELARWLITEARWPPESVLLLTDRDPASLGFQDPTRQPVYRPPTKANLDWGAREWLGQGARPGDVLLVFFAGQAVGLPEGPDDRPGQPPRDYLLPIDARDSAVDETGWKLGDAIDNLARRGDFSIVCILDTSPAGRVRPPRLLGRLARAASGDRLLRGIVRWPGVTAWLASSVGPALETGGGSGILTAALLETLTTRGRDDNLLTCLDRLRRRPELAAQAFCTKGGFGPDLTLWPGPVQPPRTKVEPLLQRGHADRVTALAFTAAGTQPLSTGVDLITASMDSTIRLWRASDGTLLRVLPTAMNGVWSLAVSRDGRLLVAGGGKGEVLFYEIGPGTRKDVPPGPPPHDGAVVESVAVLPDGHHAVTLDKKGRSLLWDIQHALANVVVSPTNLGGRLLVAAAQPGPVAFALVVPRRNGQESIRLFDRFGKEIADLPTPPERLTALALAGDGTRVAAGTEDGSVILHDAPGWKPGLRYKFDDAITSLTITPLWIAAASGRSVHVVARQDGGKDIEMALDERIARVALSVDGRWVAACGLHEGTLRAWEIAGAGRSARRLAIDEKAGRDDVLSLGFSPGGEALVVGRGKGGVQVWDLPAGTARPPISPGRGRVQHVAVAPDGQALLQIIDDGQALLWEFGKQRGPRPVLGSFLPAGGFLPSGDLVLIDHARGNIVLDRATLTRRPTEFERPMAANRGGRVTLRFHVLAISPDGNRVAAGSRDGPLACVWATATGKLSLPPIRGHEDKIRAVSFSRDGRSLLTASDDGLAKVWKLEAAGANVEWVLDGMQHHLKPVTAAALSPVDDGRVILGREDGQVELWEKRETRPIWTGQLGGQIRSVTFSPNGELLAASGDDREILLRAVSEPNRPIPLGTNPNHYEMINGLAFWPNGRLLASASDDTTVRFWRMNDRAQIGTLAAWNSGTEWVVFTPSGLFDASPGGERRVTWQQEMTRNAWADGGMALARLEQARERHHVFDLADTLSQGLDPQLPNRALKNRPPMITLEPSSPPSRKQRQVELKITLSEAGITGLSLYQNGVAIRGDLSPLNRIATATVTLMSGPNRFYALAGKEGSIDGRSAEIELTYDGRTSGRVHVLALGVSTYKSQALRYADKDAQAIARFLASRVTGPETAKLTVPILKVNGEVTKEVVEDAFRELRSRVRGRPQDTVVVFLAGHTDIRSGFFCLLLPSATLPDSQAIVALRGPTEEQQMRRPEDVLKDTSILPYAVIHNNLRSVEALNRLVIVDACEAEAVFDDPAVMASVQRRFRRAAEREAHAARTSYILATRRGERAAEPEQLEHGLLTYLLLRGMGAQGLRPIEHLPIFEQNPTADLDGDGWVETGELRQYVEMTSPVLARRFPGLVMRGNPDAPAIKPESAFTQASEGASFRLIEIAPPGARSEAP